LVFLHTDYADLEKRLICI